MALAIAAIGIYGVLAYSATQRTHEIGVRIALGAHQGGVVRLIVAEGMTVGLIGVAAGAAAALASVLFGVPARDPLTFGAVAFVLTAVALAACAPPRRPRRSDDRVAR